MSRLDRLNLALAMALLAMVAVTGVKMLAQGQGDVQPTNTLPNPYETVKDYFKLPEGRTWGSTSAVEIDKDGKSVWVAERCGQNSCVEDPTTGKMSSLDPILHFSPSGTLIKAFGAGMLTAPHGIFVDRDGNLWVTDYQDNAPRAARGTGGARGAAGGGAAAAGAGPGSGAGAAGGAAAGGQAAGGAARGGAPAGPTPGATVGHQVFKFSPDGKVLMTLGKVGGALEPDCCFQPDDVLVAPNGTIYVSQGHGSGKSEIVKFSKDGKILMRWGKTGTGQGEFDQPHTLAMDSKGRLFVGDRNNNRIQIFDQDGKYLLEWRQFSRPSGLFIDKQDNLYCADSESESVSRNHNGWKRGMRVGSAKDGTVKYFIPDPDEKATGTSAAEGVAVDSSGVIYGAEVGPKAVKRYVKK